MSAHKSSRWKNTNRRGPIRDRVNPSDFNQLNMVLGCEQCSFFEPKNQNCVFEFPAHLYTRDVQMADYERTGTISFCRHQEID